MKKYKMFSNINIGENIDQNDLNQILKRYL